MDQPPESFTFGGPLIPKLHVEVGPNGLILARGHRRLAVSLDQIEWEFGYGWGMINGVIVAMHLGGSLRYLHLYRPFPSEQLHRLHESLTTRLDDSKWRENFNYGLNGYLIYGVIWSWYRDAGKITADLQQGEGRPPNEETGKSQAAPPGAVGRGRRATPYSYPRTINSLLDKYPALFPLKQPFIVGNSRSLLMVGGIALFPLTGMEGMVVSLAVQLFFPKYQVVSDLAVPFGFFITGLVIFIPLFWVIGSKRSRYVVDTMRLHINEGRREDAKKVALRVPNFIWYHEYKSNPWFRDLIESAELDAQRERYRKFARRWCKN